MFSNSSGLKGVFEKPRFRDGFMWTVDLGVEIKSCFEIFLACCARDLITLSSGFLNVNWCLSKRTASKFEQFTTAFLKTEHFGIYSDVKLVPAHNICDLKF